MRVAGSRANERETGRRLYRSADCPTRGKPAIFPEAPSPSQAELQDLPKYLARLRKSSGRVPCKTPFDLRRF